MASQTVIPQLRMTSASKSLAFYVDGLGFAIDWRHQFGPGMPWFVQLTRSNQTIFLTEHAGDCQPGGAAYFRVTDVDQLQAEFEARGISPAYPVAPTTWGTREMKLLDPDGNQLRFATEL